MKKIIAGILVVLTSASSCKKYLDIVPDNIAEVEMAFHMRSSAERFLFTCYNWLPLHGGFNSNPAFFGGDEVWYSNATSSLDVGTWNIANGWQNVVDVYNNYWDGDSRNHGKPMFEAIRDCNTFLENVGKVPDMSEYEKSRWKAEVNFLKAYYHYWLLRMYGPIPLIRVNLPISAGIDEVQVPREPVDDCFNYIVQLIDEAIPNLPDDIENKQTEAGRVSKVIAMAIKTEILVTAASPLFNGNADYSKLSDSKGKPLFNATYDPQKWEKALRAAETAIAAAEGIGVKLYRFDRNIGSNVLSPSTKIQLSVRNALAERWNSELIWANTNSLVEATQQGYFMANVDPLNSSNYTVTGCFAPTLKMAHLFYSKNGVPIEEDKDFDYAGRFELKQVPSADRLNLISGYTTVKLHFDRENRFYGSLGFDGGVWFGHGKYNETDTWSVKAKKGQHAAPSSTTKFSITGYFAKKLPHFESVIGTGGNYSAAWYPWPVMRLANLYLLHAEASNEFSGPGAETFRYLDSVRIRAGVPKAVDAWALHSTNPGKVNTKEGLRSIIQQERSIELAFEGQRFWDLRRWKTAQRELNTAIQGWNLDNADAAGYYQVRTIYTRKFQLRDYLWPIQEKALLANRNLVQNPGW